MMAIFDEAVVGQFIFEQLATNIGSNVYFNRADKDATFPYAVFNMLNAFQQEGTGTEFMLEFDIWHNKGNQITDLLKLQKKIQVFLHKRVCQNSELSLFFNLESTLNLDFTQEEQIRRRQLRFLVQYNNNEE